MHEFTPTDQRGIQLELEARHSNLRTPPSNPTGSHPTMSANLVLIYNLNRMSVQSYQKPDEGDRESVPETLVDLNFLMQQSAEEDLIEFCHCESFKTFMLT
jgi:hypothetical protein